MAAYNLVVDSNVESPSTYGPKSAYLGARICNDGATTVSNVTAYIGDFNGTNNTPGIYPARANPPLVGPLPGGQFALTHQGGSAGTSDAIRYLGVIHPGECVMVYWLVSYPQTDVNGDAVWGPSVKPDDDLWLKYDVWATGTRTGTAVTAEEERTVTMRNEISAMANKIMPNTANKVPQQYLDLLALYAPTWTNVASDGTPGSTISAEGYWYDLGNIGQGFDNNGDLIPDRNAWMQPVGDPTIFDPSCFRLVHTYAFVVVKLKGGGELVLTGDDQLYFENVPDNTGAIGFVGYRFQVLHGGCYSTMSPYQEVASGYDNEKFNGDYGATVGGALISQTSRVAMTKSASPAAASPGSVLNYAIAFTNQGAVAVGNPSAGLPLVIQDRIPTGTTYVAGSAAASNSLPAGVSAYNILYSTNYGIAWSGTEPVPATNVTDVQWWLSDPLRTGAVGTVRFQVTVKNSYPVPSPVVSNTAGLSFGTASPFLQSSASTLLTGTNRLNGTVYGDTGVGGGVFGNGFLDGTEPGISNVTVTLYYDVNSNGVVDASDVLYTTNRTLAGTGGYSFTNLPDGNYVVVVNSLSTNIPPGYTPTSLTYLPASLDPSGTNVNSVVVSNLNFGFAPVLNLTKSGPTNLLEGQLATYTLTVTNRLAGNGTLTGQRVAYDLWATTNNATLTGNTANKQLVNQATVWSPAAPDTNYATTTFANTEELLGLQGYTTATQAYGITNVSIRIPVQVTGSFRADDQLVVSLFTNNLTAPSFATTSLVGSLSTGTLQFNVTTNLPWTWALLSNPTSVIIQIKTAKGTGSPGGGTFGIDQIGLRVQTDGTLGTASTNNTLNPVPLYDYFNTNIFSFVSAVPPVTSRDTNGPAPQTGRLYWSNLGPLYPGGVTSVTVNLRVLQPPNNSPYTTTNIAVITNATYASGRPANSATSLVMSAIQPAGTIGDFIWRDLNGDGVQNGGSETGIAGVKVVLTPPAGVDLGNGAGNPITNTTDASGFYLFTSLPSNGNYTVTVLTNSLPGGVGVNTWDRDGNSNNTTTVSLTVTSTNGADTVLNADFGYRNLQSQLSGSIWNDVNRNGATTPDSGEPFLTNITVRLYDSNNVLVATTTATNGTFNFFGSFGGNYTVKVDTNTGQLATGTWTESYDTDGTNTQNQATVSVVSGGSATADFSYYRAGALSIGDTIFYDWNGNGLQNANDEGITNVTVRLYLDINTNGVYDPGIDPLVQTRVTDTNGTYLFTTLASNRYIVVVDGASAGLPTSYTITGDPQGAFDGISAVTLTTSNNLAQDFGYQPRGTGSIGDTVWRDVNADGVQSGALETGISNITVTLQVDFNGDGTYVTLTTTVTSASGTYLFSGLPDGRYRVVVDSSDTDLPRDAFGNPFYPTTATFYNVVIAGGNSYLAADFGFASLGAIGDTIFWDANQNGTQDASEGGATNVTVQLYRDVDGNGVYSAGDTLYAATNTDASGKYLFTGLPPSNYVVVVVTTGTLSGVALSADPDSDGVPCWSPLATDCDSQTGVSLLPGQSFMGADFGYVPPGAVIGDAVWIDFNHNGVFDPAEGGIPYITVSLYAGTALVATTETDAGGNYLFYGLSSGAYRVVVSTNDVDWPSGLTQTYDPDGVNNSIASNIVVSGGTVTSIGGVSCTNCSLGVDFGYRYVGTNVLSGTIGMDDPSNIDGKLGTGTSGVGSNEVAFGAVPVYAYLWNDNGDGVVQPGEYVLVNSTVTSTNGDYAFTDLPPGDGNDLYLISIAAPLGSLYLTTTTNSTPATVLVNTTDAQGFTTSIYQGVPIAPLIQNMDFAFISGVGYDFGDLPDSYQTTLTAGARHVVPAVPNLYLGTNVDTEANGHPSTGADGDDVSGSDDENGVLLNGVWQNGSTGSVKVTVGAGAGYLVAYVDFNNNGSFADAGDMIISATVSNTGGAAANGVYTFSFPVPAGALSTTNTARFYSRFRLFPSQPIFPLLAYSGEASNGEVEDYRFALNVIRGAVYQDTDTNSVFSGGDSIQPGVVVGLYDATTNLIATTVTALDGSYYFNGLPDGSYFVRMTTPSGASAILDADGNANGSTNIAVTLSGASAFGENFLLNTNAARAGIAGTVYEDGGFGAAGNGIFDGTDAVVPNVAVSLYRDINGDGIAQPSELVGSTVTDLGGAYSFTNLPSGNYLVIMNTPSGATSITDADGNGNGSSEIAVSLAGTDVTGRDFLVDGTAMVGMIGDRVWFDSNGNGVQDGSETTGITNVPVYLVNTAGVVIAQTTTDTNGFYAFSYFPQGTYTVQFDLSSITSTGNVRVADANQGTNDAADSDGISGDVGHIVSTAPIVLTVGSTNLTIDLGIAYIRIKTRAAVADVWGEWRDGRGYVVWRTSSEWGTAGFRVYRVNPGSGVETLLNDALVPSAFDPNGSIYELADPAAAAGTTSVYRIEEAELAGDRLDMGTQELSFGAPVPRPSPTKAPSSSAKPARASLAAPASTPSDCLKVSFRKEGIYGIGFADLATGMGITQQDVVDLLAANGIALTAMGSPVPYFVDEAASRIVFFGRKVDDFYTRDAVYMIKPGTGLRMERWEPGGGTGTDVFPVHVRFEEDRYIFDSLGTPVDDLFYWDYIISGNATYGSRTFPIDLTGYAGGNVTLKVRLIGMSVTASQPDHMAEIRFNGSLLSTVPFNGQDEKETSVIVPANLVVAGTNTVTITGTRPASSGSFFALDWIDADFTRTLTPGAGTLRFMANDASVISAAHFSQPVALSVADPDRPIRIADANGALSAKAWIASPDEAFALVEGAEIPMLAPAAAACTAWFMAPDNRIDYLIIVSRDMASSAQALAAYRSGQGLRVGVAVFEDVCDLMAHGRRTPEAIKSLLQYATETWAEAPWLVVLAGNGNYDFLNALNLESNPLPPMLYRSSSGIFAADGLLTDFDGDLIPDIAIGRLPALNTSQLDTMIAKIVAHEEGFAQGWQRNLVLAADTREGTGQFGSPADFAADSERLAGIVGNRLNATRIYRDDLTVTAARSQVAAAFNGGSGIVHYMGHGNPTTMGRTSSTALLRDTDVNAMTNVPEPVLVALSCLVGRFEAPGNSSLGELLLRRAQGGAVAAWGPSGLSVHNNAMQLGEAFYHALLDGGCNTLGLAVLRARQALAPFDADREPLVTYNLLGDPALKLGGIPGGDSRDSGFSQWRWQRFDPGELSDPAVSGETGVANGSSVPNFVDYALGLDPGAIVVPQAIGIWGLASDGGLIVNWNRRIVRKDIVYRLRVSDNLQTWEDDPPYLQTLSVSPDADGVLETVRTKINRGDTKSLFIDVRFLRP